MKQSIEGPCICPICNGLLDVKLAKGGKHPGHHYLQCWPCKYHYVFPKHDIVQEVPPVISATLPAPSASLANRCTGSHCTRPFHILCARRMCKQCCIFLSGCRAPKHQYTYLSEKQKGKIRAPPIPPPLDEHSSSKSFSDGIRALSDALGKDPTTAFLESEAEKQRKQQAQEAEDLAAEREEERDYQAAIAASLGVPYITPREDVALSTPTASSSSSKISQPAAATQRPTPAVPRHTGPVQTVPYHEPSITRHMNTDWMRPHEDNTHKRPQAVRRPRNKFVIVFWKEVGMSPIVYAVDDCPQWPTWSLIDSYMVQEELGILCERLEFYDVRHAQWVSCSPSYPHDVKPDGRLLLRRPGIICQDLDTHLEHVVEKPVHMRFNMPGERSIIRDQLRLRAQKSHISVISLSDDSEVEFVDPVTPVGKRSRESSEECGKPTKRIRELSTPISVSSSLSSTPASQSVFSISELSTPRKSYENDEIFVPLSTKPWPSGMYTVDMAKGFRKVNSPTMKKAHSMLAARLADVFKTEIHSNTYHDQVRVWKRAPEHVREAHLRRGRGDSAGLWSAFRRDAKKSNA